VFAKWPAFPAGILQTMQRHWPRTSSEKQVCFAQILMAMTPVFLEAELAVHLPTIMRFVMKLLTGTNFLALRAILPAFETSEWRTILGGMPRNQRQPLGETFMDLETRHWDVNIRAAAQILAARYPSEPLPGERRSRSIAGGRMGGLLLLAQPDKFFDGWRAVMKEGGKNCDGLDQIEFMQKVSELSFSKAEETECASVRKLRSGRRGSCDVTTSALF
jgi:hypothetical protein